MVPRLTAALDRRTNKMGAYLVLLSQGPCMTEVKKYRSGSKTMFRIKKNSKTPHRVTRDQAEVKSNNLSMHTDTRGLRCKTERM